MDYIKLILPLNLVEALSKHPFTVSYIQTTVWLEYASWVFYRSWMIEMMTGRRRSRILLLPSKKENILTWSGRQTSGIILVPFQMFSCWTRSMSTDWELRLGPIEYQKHYMLYILILPRKFSSVQEEQREHKDTLIATLLRNTSHFWM
jgi:hypothetical protein